MREKAYIIATIIAITLVVMMVFSTVAYSQETVIVLDDALEVELNTWEEYVSYWMPKALQAILALIGSALLLALRQGVTMLPDVLKVYIEGKRQNDLQSAIKSKVGQLMAEGRWPTTADLTAVGAQGAAVLSDAVLEELRRYVLTSVPQAGEWANMDKFDSQAKNILKTIALRKAVELDPVTAIPVIDTRHQ